METPYLTLLSVLSGFPIGNKNHINFVEDHSMNILTKLNCNCLCDFRAEDDNAKVMDNTLRDPFAQMI